MTKKFNGNNDIVELRRLFFERMNYYGNALEDENGDRLDGIVDLNRFAQVYRGRCDEKMNTIIPKNEVIKYGSDSSIKGVNYAVDAFDDFLNEWKFLFSSQNLNLFEDDPYLSNIKCYKSYAHVQTPELIYDKHLSSVSSTFIEWTRESEVINSITDFKDYVKYFLFFLQEKGSEMPFTLTGWQKSNFSNIYTSGLVFSVADLDCGDDAQKETFINSLNFPTYRNRARTHGFQISLWCPWMLIFNPISNTTKAQQYREDNDVWNRFNSYNISYNKTYLNDIINLRLNLINIYNKFVLNNPFRHEKQVICGKTRKCNFQRLSVNENNINNQYSDLQFHILYAEIRNSEEGSPFPPPDMARLKQKATFFHKKLDNMKALSYINDQFRFSYILKSGSLNQYLANQSED